MVIDDELKWVTISQDIDGPKLSWIVNRFNENGIAVRIRPGMRGTKLQTHDTDLLMALHQLNAPIGELHIGVSEREITIDDLPNNHEHFRTKMSPELVEKLLDELKQEEDMTGTAHAIDDIWDCDEQSIKGDEILGKLKGTHIKVPLLDNLGEELTVIMYDVASSNMSQIGFYNIVAEDYSLLGKEKITLYARFKSNPNIYAYVPVKAEIFDTLYQEALKAERNEPDASVGGLFHALVKVDAESEKIKCYKLGDDNRWQTVLPRAKRVKDIKLQHGK